MWGKRERLKRRIMKKYQIIYADPAWLYNDKRKGSLGGAENHYKTMRIEEIKKLGISNICDENCILFLWVVFPMLQEGLDVIKAWGFKYKTLGFSWIKLNKKSNTPFFGIGHYTKSNCEVCLIGVKGKPVIIDNHVSSVIIERRYEHSKKPVSVRNKIVQLLGDIPRIELFARQKTEGWDCIGNDINGKDIKQELEELCQN
jgi:N6-adenosine-specific RNA methylase IME4